MSDFVLPPLKRAEKFEHLICDLFNNIESDDSYRRVIDYQTFGVNGQNQKGIDIISQKSKTLIQCKVKNLRGKDDTKRNTLLVAFNNDLAKMQGLKINFERLIFTSTYRDDTIIQETLSHLQHERGYDFNIYYWGWDTITRHLEEYPELLSKYFPQFFKRPKTSNTNNLPAGALGTDLMKKNYINHLISRYGDWKEKEPHVGKFNYAWFKKRLKERYKASGINHIPLSKFEDLVIHLKGLIDGTRIGKGRVAKGQANYSSFEKYFLDNS